MDIKGLLNKKGWAGAGLFSTQPQNINKNNNLKVLDKTITFEYNIREEGES